jgi:5-hydroxyisourate hydrolase-like protein (transthyretin family)
VDCWGENSDGAANDRAAEPGGSADQTFSIVVAPAIGTISGTVTEEGTGTPLAQVAVRLLDGTTGVTTVVTDANGDYEFTAVPVGANYRVRFTDQTARHLTEYNGDSTKYSTTPPLSVTVLATTTVDAALAVNTAAAAITGQVTAAGSGTPLAGVTIQVYRNDVLVKTANTDTNGEFLVGGLDPTGTWKVRYRDATGTYRGAYWNGQASLATATGITLTAGAVTDADAALVAR